jgi:phospholipid/cholesterol/gamma-HCH transport system substrate-binding protein
LSRFRGALGGLLALVVVVAIYLLLAAPSGTEYKLVFTTDELVVLGDPVEVGGVPVGSVTALSLTHGYKAQVTIHVDSSLTPLHQGTSAEIRIPSLSGVADRYIALTPGPNNYPALAAGATITKTQSPVDLDELFNTLNPKTRKGLQQVIDGFAAQYAGAENEVGAAVGYFPPALRALDHVFAELTSDERTFTDFLVNVAQATSVVGARSASLESLIGNADTTFAAIGAQQGSLARGLKQLPVTLTEGTNTFAALPPTVAALRRLLEVSKADTKTLPSLLARLTPLVDEATPVVRDLGTAIEKPGANNDLTDAALALPALAKTLQTASPDTVKALREGLGDSALFAPYAPDVEGFLRGFGESTAYYDADGHYAHVLPEFDSFKLNSENRLIPVNSLQEGLAGLKTGQLTRCPGAATAPAKDGSSPFEDSGQLGCNPAETP